MRINDNVVLMRPLGQGGMGSVWVARHETLKTEVAVKFIGGTLAAADSEVLERFNREASTAAQIKSPYVVQTFDQGVTDSGIPYIVMELLEGESLDDRISSELVLELETTEIVIAQTAKALAAAHGRGIIHRDIKPQNIFLTHAAGDLHVKVFDFGIAKQTNIPMIDGLTMSGQPVGTPEFMSPEQLFDAKNVDHRADLWSLAVVAYCCLTGRLPYEADTLPALCKLLLRAKCTPPSAHRAELTPEVDAWFARALSPDIKERFGTAKEMAVAFVRVLSAVRSQEAAALEALFITSEDTMPPFPVAQLTGSAPPVPASPPRRSSPGPAPRSAALVVPTAPARPARRFKLWAAIALAAALVVLIVVLRPQVGTSGDHAQSARVEATVAAPTPTIVEATTSHERTKTAPKAEDPAQPRPTVIDGQDAAGWRNVLRGAALRGDSAVAADAFVALARLAPEQYGDRETIVDAATAAHLAASSSQVNGDRVFELLAGDALGEHAPDILFRITSVHGGSPAAKRAAELLAAPTVIERATPALRIALEMREAGCRSRPALFERAAADGDDRTLYLLLQMRSESCGQISCCMKDEPRLDNAINQIRTRVKDSN